LFFWKAPILNWTENCAYQAYLFCGHLQTNCTIAAVRPGHHSNLTMIATSFHCSSTAESDDLPTKISLYIYNSPLVFAGFCRSATPSPGLFTSSLCGTTSVDHLSSPRRSQAVPGGPRRSHVAWAARPRRIQSRLSERISRYPERSAAAQLERCRDGRCN